MTDIVASYRLDAQGVAEEVGDLRWGIATELHAWRSAMGLSQREVAELTGINRPNISRLEAPRNPGQRQKEHTPSLATVVALAHAMGTDAAALLEAAAEHAREAREVGDE